MNKRGILLDFFGFCFVLYARHSTLLHLPPNPKSIGRLFLMRSKPITVHFAGFFEGSQAPKLSWSQQNHGTLISKKLRTGSFFSDVLNTLVETSGTWLSIFPNSFYTNEMLNFLCLEKHKQAERMTIEKSNILMSCIYICLLSYLWSALYFGRVYTLNIQRGYSLLSFIES